MSELIPPAVAIVASLCLTIWNFLLVRRLVRIKQRAEPMVRWGANGINAEERNLLWLELAKLFSKREQDGMRDGGPRKSDVAV